MLFCLKKKKKCQQARRMLGGGTVATGHRGLGQRVLTYPLPKGQTSNLSTGLPEESGGTLESSRGPWLDTARARDLTGTSRGPSRLRSSPSFSLSFPRADPSQKPDGKGTL